VLNQEDKDMTFFYDLNKKLSELDKPKTVINDDKTNKQTAILEQAGSDLYQKYSIQKQLDEKMFVDPDTGERRLIPKPTLPQSQPQSGSQTSSDTQSGSEPQTGDRDNEIKPKCPPFTPASKCNMREDELSEMMRLASMEKNQVLEQGAGQVSVPNADQIRQGLDQVGRAMLQRWQKEQETARQNRQFTADVDRVKNSNWVFPNNVGTAPLPLEKLASYSKERGMETIDAADRLQQRGVDILGLARNRVNPSTLDSDLQEDPSSQQNTTQFQTDLNRVQSSMYMKPGDTNVYSRERGLGPSQAARRLSDRGVDIPGLVGNRVNPSTLDSDLQEEDDLSEMMRLAGMEEGNEFSGALDAARDAGEKTFDVDGQTYPVKEGVAENGLGAYIGRTTFGPDSKAWKESVKGGKGTEQDPYTFLPGTELNTAGVLMRNLALIKAGKEPSYDNFGPTGIKIYFEYNGKLYVGDGSNKIMRANDDQNVAEGSKHASRPGTKGRPGSAEQAQADLNRKRQFKADSEKRIAEGKNKGQDVAEGSKPDFPDIDKDGNTTEPIGQAAKDAAKRKIAGKRYGGAAQKDDQIDQEPSRGPGRPEEGGPKHTYDAPFGTTIVPDWKGPRTVHKISNVEPGKEAVKRGRPKKGKEVKEDPANTPMPGNKLSPKDQFKSIMTDVDTVEKGYNYDPTTGERRLAVRGLGPGIAAKHLEKDSAQGRFAAPGFGDQGQFIMGPGNLNERGEYDREGEQDDMIDIVDRGEYDREGDMAHDQLRTILDAAEELRSILTADENLPEWVQSKITKALDYIDTARDYMKSQKSGETEPVNEKAVSRAQRRAAGIAHAAQKGKIPKKKLRGASKEMAKMPRGELKKFAKTKETDLPTKVKETTTSGSVATSDVEAKPKKSKGGVSFGKGIYDSWNRELEVMIAESMDITVNQHTQDDGSIKKTITVNATDEDAEQLAQLLNLAGMDQHDDMHDDHMCPVCHQDPCECAEIVDENSPDWPTSTEYNDDPLQYSGGLNRPKSTGQTTVPVIASQLDRQMSEDDELARLKKMLG
jgi:hypothetical protein